MESLATVSAVEFMGWLQGASRLGEWQVQGLQALGRADVSPSPTVHFSGYASIVHGRAKQRRQRGFDAERVARSDVTPGWLKQGTAVQADGGIGVARAWVSGGQIQRQ